MKLYQIHEQSGEYDMYIDVVFETFFSKELAEERIKVLENINKTMCDRFEQCTQCSRGYYEGKGLPCEFYASEDSYLYDCTNDASNWEYCHYTLEEVETEDEP